MTIADKAIFKNEIMLCIVLKNAASIASVGIAKSINDDTSTEPPHDNLPRRAMENNIVTRKIAIMRDTVGPNDTANHPDNNTGGKKNASPYSNKNSR